MWRFNFMIDIGRQTSSETIYPFLWLYYSLMFTLSMVTAIHVFNIPLSCIFLIKVTRVIILKLSWGPFTMSPFTMAINMANIATTHNFLFKKKLLVSYLLSTLWDCCQKSVLWIWHALQNSKLCHIWLWLTMLVLLEYMAKKQSLKKEITKMGAFSHDFINWKKNTL